MSLNALVGETGIMENAKKASREWNENAAEELAELDSISWNKYLQVTEVPKPTAVITNGEAGTNGWYKGAEVKIKLTQDAGFTDKIEKMTYKINGTQGTTGEITIANEGIITITQDGINTITAWVYDTDGNPSDPEIIRINKDSVGPILGGLSTVDVYEDEEEAFDFISGVTVKDDISGVLKVDSKDFTYSPSTLNDGLNRITYTATDNAGNVTTQERFVNYIVSHSSCFVAGTLVSTPKGLVPIETIEVGDEVYSMNMDTKMIELAEATNTYRSTSKALYTITAGTDRIKTTKEHPFYIIGKGWVIAGDLEIGDKLIGRDQSKYDICYVEVSDFEEDIVVYNLEVNSNHNYFVGENQILVHNKPY